MSQTSKCNNLFAVQNIIRYLVAEICHIFWNFQWVYITKKNKIIALLYNYLTLQYKQGEYKKLVNIP